MRARTGRIWGLSALVLLDSLLYLVQSKDISVKFTWIERELYTKEDDFVSPRFVQCDLRL